MGAYAKLMLACLAVAACVTPIQAQTRAPRRGAAPAPAVAPDTAQGEAASPEARRDEIAKVQEMLADPDPLMRQANMEAIVKSGDSLKLQTALRTAFSSDDRELSGLAMRGYLATRKAITFEVAMPQDVVAAQEAAGTDPKAMRAFSQRYPFYAFVTRAASRFELDFPDYAFGQDRGTAYFTRQSGAFTVVGDRVMTNLPLHNWGQCYVDFAPTRRQTFEGTLACGNWPKLRITAPSL